MTRSTQPAPQGEAKQGGRPSLEQQLRLIDLKFECAAEAKKHFPSPDGPCFGDETPRTNPHFRPAYRFLLAQAMRREGLPVSMLGDGKTASQRHFERMHAEHGTPLPWARGSEQAA